MRQLNANSHASVDTSISSGWYAECLAKLVYIPDAPKANDKLAKKGQIAFDFGKFWSEDRGWEPGNATSRPTTGSS